jgi:hypothetical protein
VNIGAEYLQAFLLVFLEQRRTCEADEHRTWKQCFHGFVEITGMCAVTLVHEDIALGLEPLR